MKNILICAVLVVQILSCSNGNGPEQADPKLSFSPEEISVSTGSQTDISIKVSDFKTEIFAISMQLNYDARILSIDESAGFSAGDFFGQNEISLIKTNGNKIHLSISLTQGTASAKGSGTLGTFTLNGIAAGNCFLSIAETELVFYDESGNSVEISNLETASTLIKVE